MDESYRPSPKERLRAISRPPFDSVNALKNNTVSYMRQYRQYQWLAASRRLLPNIAPEDSDAPRSEEYALGELDEDNEMLLARVHRVQYSLQNCFSELDSKLSRLHAVLLSSRGGLWLKTGVFTLLASALLSILLTSNRRGQPQLLRLMPGLFQPLIPLAPLPIAIYFIVAREHRISCVNAAKDRLNDLRAAVDRLEHVSVDEVKWIGKTKWDGVDWSFIGL